MHRKWHLHFSRIYCTLFKTSLNSVILYFFHWLVRLYKNVGMYIYIIQYVEEDEKKMFIQFFDSSQILMHPPWYFNDFRQLWMVLLIDFPFKITTNFKTQSFSKKKRECPITYNFFLYYIDRKMICTKMMVQQSHKICVGGDFTYLTDFQFLVQNHLNFVLLFGYLFFKTLAIMMQRYAKHLSQHKTFDIPHVTNI